MMFSDCTESTRAGQEIDVDVSYDRSTFTAVVPALDLTLSSDSLVALRSLVAEAVAGSLAPDAAGRASLQWRYEPLAGRHTARVVELPAQRDPTDGADDASSASRSTALTQAMVDRKLDELRQRRRSVT